MRAVGTESSKEDGIRFHRVVRPAERQMKVALLEIDGVLCMSGLYFQCDPMELSAILAKNGWNSGTTASFQSGLPGVTSSALRKTAGTQ